MAGNGKGENGRREPAGAREADGEPRFFADCMLGRLARWLRILGVDVAYEHAIEDAELAERCREEGRVLLTRDTLLARQADGISVLLVESQEIAEQVRQVVDHFALALQPEHLFSRCTICNGPVEDITREQARGRVPPYVLESEERFRRCPNCDKIYWRGTHRERFLSHLFPDPEL